MSGGGSMIGDGGEHGRRVGWLGNTGEAMGVITRVGRPGMCVRMEQRPKGADAGGWR